MIIIVELNPSQRELVENTEGIFVVDAGAGTGKTATITRRYSHILDTGMARPEEMLLITFTRNAAQTMKDRILQISDYSAAELADADINTFHAFCKQLLSNYGFSAPQYLGIAEPLPSNVVLLDNRIREEEEFRRFYAQFQQSHPEHAAFYPVITDATSLLALIQSLAAKGIFPTQDGWFGAGERYLDGDADAFRQIINDVNQPGRGESGKEIQSPLRKKLAGYGQDKCYFQDAPTAEQLGIVHGSTQINYDWLERAFYEDRQDLKAFIHDLYFAYIHYALQRNYVNFSFLLMFAFILLHENHDLRKELQYQYIMVDEFQDTNELQFKLILLLSSTGNIAVVGDWKQSIYSFQHASVNNILQFEKRIDRYIAELNADTQRVAFSNDMVQSIELRANYRSSQEILDYAEETLYLRGARNEYVDREQVDRHLVHLAAQQTPQTAIQKLTSEEEEKAVLSTIQNIVGNQDYLIQEEDGERVPDYSDIAILTRTQAFGLTLQRMADQYNIPVVYEGGIPLFQTDPGILLLAWLRIAGRKHSRRGWAVVLEQAGYRLPEARHILDTQDYPQDMWTFRHTLLKTDTIGEFARAVFEKYGLHSDVTAAIIAVLEQTFSSSYMHFPLLARFISQNIEQQMTYPVDRSHAANTVTVQTIHSAKGLEYPIVIVADITASRFPSKGGRSGNISYDEVLGLRQRRIYATEPYPYTYWNWHTDLLFPCLSGQYAEERRLFYVAMTRAQQYLLLSAETGKESSFFTELSGDAVCIQPDVSPVTAEETVFQQLSIAPPENKAPVKRTPHATAPTASPSGRGPAFGHKVHQFACRYANGEPVTPEDQDEQQVQAYIDSLSGTVGAEVPCYLPTTEGERPVLYEGVIDLLHVTDDTVEVIDFKTDLDRANEDEYRQQLVIYQQAVAEAYPDKTVKATLFYTADGSRHQVL